MKIKEYLDGWILGQEVRLWPLVFSENQSIFGWMDFGSKSKAIAFGF